MGADYAFGGYDNATEVTFYNQPLLITVILQNRESDIASLMLEYYGMSSFDVECLVGTSNLLDILHVRHVLRHQAHYTK